MTPITKQFSKIILNKVKEYKALTEPSYKKKKKKEQTFQHTQFFYERYLLSCNIGLDIRVILDELNELSSIPILEEMVEIWHYLSFKRLLRIHQWVHLKLILSVWEGY